MAERTHATKQATRTDSKQTEEPEEAQEPARAEKTGVAVVDVIDDWLSEIDDILEENDAAEFVKNYVQKGGE